MARSSTLIASRALCPNVAHVLSDYSMLRTLEQFNATISFFNAQDWEAANRILYIPFWLPAPYRVGKLEWLNGNNVSGNVEMGVYSAGGVLLCRTGTIAQATTGVPQSAAPTVATTLTPDRYYWGITMSGTTNARIERIGLTTLQIPYIRSAGILKESSDPGSFGLVATATFATVTSTHFPAFTGSVPLLGMIEDTTLSY